MQSFNKGVSLKRYGTQRGGWETVVGIVLVIGNCHVDAEG